MTSSLALTLVVMFSLRPAEGAYSKRFSNRQEVQRYATIVTVDNDPPVVYQTSTGVGAPRKQFQIVSQMMDWFQARSYCQRIGKVLATLRTRSDHLAVKKVIKAEGVSSDSFWLAGHNLLDRGRNNWAWRVWSYDEPFQYSNWLPRKPDPMDSERNCLMIHNSYRYFKWDQFDCKRNLKFICEEISCQRTVIFVETPINKTKTNEPKELRSDCANLDSPKPIKRADGEENAQKINKLFTVNATSEFDKIPSIDLGRKICKNRRFLTVSTLIGFCKAKNLKNFTSKMKN